MSIQAGINQALSVAGFFASQSPALQAKAKERAEVSAINVKQKKIGKQVDTIAKEGMESLTAATTEEELEGVAKSFSDLAKVQTQSAKLAKKKFELQPTLDNYRAIGLKEGSVNVLKEQAKTITEAREKLFAKQEEKRAARRSFIDYMKDEPTSFGKTIGELDPKIQQTILKDYSKAERKKIMDERDKLNGNK